MTHFLPITEASILEASLALKQGQLVAIPTETVYGLAAIATSSKAVADIYALKNRPVFNPLISHVSSLEEAQTWGYFSEATLMLAQKFWPGALTLVVRKKENMPLSDLVTAGLATMALRVPDHPLVRQLIRQVGAPLAAPSANPSESISPTRAQDVYNSFKEDPRLAYILDGGACSIGLESTIIDVSGEKPMLLRPGGISLEEIESVIGPVVSDSSSSDTIKAPGQMKRHYAPSKPLRLNALEAEKDEALLCFGPQNHGQENALNLSPQGCLKEAACNLFYMMRTLDHGPLPKIAVQPIPQQGLGTAINDRLQRAAYIAESL